MTEQNAAAADVAETQAKPSRPKSAKEPQDRKSKADVVKSDKVEVTVGVGDDQRTVPAFRVTVNSLTVTVLEEVFTDAEFVEIMADVQAQGGTPVDTIRLLRMMLSADDYGRMKTALRGTNGRVSIEDTAKFSMQLMEAINPSS